MEPVPGVAVWLSRAPPRRHERIRSVLCSLPRCAARSLVPLFLGAAAGPGTAQSAPPVLNPENGHWYQAVRVPGGITWDEARGAAEQRALAGYRGHLVTLTSDAGRSVSPSRLPLQPGNLVDRRLSRPKSTRLSRARRRLEMGDRGAVELHPAVHEPRSPAGQRRRPAGRGDPGRPVRQLLGRSGARCPARRLPR